MNDMSDLEAVEANVPDAPELVTEIVAFQALLVVDVGEDTIPLALPDVEGLAVPRVNEPVDVSLELARHFRRKRLPVRMSQSPTPACRLGCVAPSSEPD